MLNSVSAVSHEPICKVELFLQHRRCTFLTTTITVTINFLFNQSASLEITPGEAWIPMVWIPMAWIPMFWIAMVWIPMEWTPMVWIPMASIPMVSQKWTPGIYWCKIFYQSTNRVSALKEDRLSVNQTEMLLLWYYCKENRKPEPPVVSSDICQTERPYKATSRRVI